MRLRFLINECLSPELVQLAVNAGHLEPTCVRDCGLSGIKDWKLIEHVVARDFTLVTPGLNRSRCSSGIRRKRRRFKQPTLS